MTEPACRFCRGNGLLDDSPVHETGHFYTLMSRDPELPRAAMVIPKRHSPTPFEMTAEEWADLPAALAATRDLLGRHAPAGFTLGWNVGAVAGQTVNHTHLHVIARFGDEPLAGKGLRHAFKIAAGVNSA